MKTLIITALLISTQTFAETLENPQDLMLRCQESLEGRGDLKWSLVRVRTILEMGIKVPVLASFSINPEIELYFTKK